jgi:hypothetical protein
MKYLNIFNSKRGKDRQERCSWVGDVVTAERVWTLNMTQLSFSKKIDVYVSLIFYTFGALIYFFDIK